MHEKGRIKAFEGCIYINEIIGLGLVINYLSLGSGTFGVPLASASANLRLVRREVSVGPYLFDRETSFTTEKIRSQGAVPKKHARPSTETGAIREHQHFSYTGRNVRKHTSHPVCRV
jgi:hypothetical protein